MNFAFLDIIGEMIFFPFVPNVLVEINNWFEFLKLSYHFLPLLYYKFLA